MTNKLFVVAAAYAFCAAINIANAQAFSPILAQALADAPEALTAVSPNANLHLEGIPPVPLALAEQVARYTRFTGQSFVAWHPKSREMLVSMRPTGGSIAQLFTVAPPASGMDGVNLSSATPARPRQITDFSEPLGAVSFEPLEGKYLVLARGTGGDEAYQLYRLDLDVSSSGNPKPAKDALLLTDATKPRERHALEGWAHSGERLLFTSVPLDAKGSDGNPEEKANDAVNTRLSSINPLQPGSTKQLAELPGTGWFGFRFSRDDSLIVARKYTSVNHSDIWLLDNTSGKPLRILLGSAPNAVSANSPVGFKHSGGKPVGVYVITDRFGEFSELALVDIATGNVKRISVDTPWDITSFSQSDDGALIAALANIDGRSELRLYDGSSGKPVALPTGLPEGSISATIFHRTRPELMLSVVSARSPGAIYSINLHSQKMARWTRDNTPRGLDFSDIPEQQVVRWASFDKRQISGILNLPPARFSGKRPVIITIHGGPEGQSKTGFLGRNNYFVNELGIAIIAPNVRGSTGYGKTFLKLDNGLLREDSVKDIGALLDWIATQPNLDASRVLVTGGSYGGYMALAVSTHYASRIAGAIDVVGISHFLTFLKNTESYRRDLRRVEYGDEREAAMREHLHAISPLTNAHKITKPLFVVQGKNDPRVPYTEAEQIVAKARSNAANSANVWYLRADNEGHGFRRKENTDFQFYATVMFLQQTLLKP